MTMLVFQRAFQELTDDELETVMKTARTQTYSTGETLITEGENPDNIMVILDGEIRVVRLGRDGEEKELSDPLSAGDTVGEMSFVDQMGASATLIAKTDVTVQSVDQDMVNDMKEADPTFAGRLYKSLLFTVIRRLRLLDYKVTFPDS